MPGPTETILIEVTGDSQGAAKMLADLFSQFKDLALELTKLNGAASGVTGLKNVADQAKATGQETEGAGGILEMLVGVLSKINPASIIAALGLGKLVQAIAGLKDEILATVDHAQALEINLESLAARELVKAGDFETSADAMDTAALAADGMLAKLEEIGLLSPYVNARVEETFRSMMAYGWASNQAMDLTQAMLDLAAASGKTGWEMARIGINLGQIRSKGMIAGQELRDLRGLGIDLADILQDQLGISVEQFNANMKSGAMTMDDFAGAIEGYVEENFAGAAAELARTVEGIKNSVSDLRSIALKKIFKPAIDVLIAPIADAFDVANEWVRNSGALEKAGAFLEKVANGIVSIVGAITGFIGPALAQLGSGLAAIDIFHNIGPQFRIIAGQIVAIATQIYTMVIPGFILLGKYLATIPWGLMLTTLQDVVSAILSVISDLLSGIQSILEGDIAGAVDPLYNAFLTALTAIAVLLDVFVGKMFVWGWNLVVQLANGIIAAASSALKVAMNFVGRVIGMFLKPGSPPKEGPLSHIVEWGRGLINTFIQSFKTADFSILKSALSPIQQAFQDAFAAGNLTEPEYLEQFGVVREQVVALISDFRETGEINQGMLDGISQSLGEGGRELVKYLELQLRYQQAMEHLASIQDEVTAAEKAGFVSKSLKDRLAAAEAEAEALEDQVNWQKELIALQRESVDLQLRLIKAIEKLAEAGGGGGGGGGGAGAGAGAEIPVVPEFVSGIGGLLGEGEGKTSKDNPGLKGFSDEFERMRRKIEKFLQAPFDKKIDTIVQAFGRLTGVDMSPFIAALDKLIVRSGKFVEAPIEKKIETFADSFTRLTGINASGFWDSFQKGIGIISNFNILKPSEQVDLIATAFTNLTGIDVVTPLGNIRGAMVKVSDYITMTLAPAVTTFADEKLANLTTAFTTAKDYIRNDLLPAFTDWKSNIETELGVAIETLSATTIGNLLTAFGNIVTTVSVNVITALTDLRDYIVDTLGPDMDTFKTGKADKLKSSFDFIKGAIDDAKEAAETFINFLANAIIPPWARGDSPPPLADWFSYIADSTQAAAGEMKAFNNVLGGQLSRTRLSLAGTAIQSGGIVMIDGGMNFPNVRDGRDAASVRRELRRMADEAAAISKVKGSM